tara:strand:- start:1284 stop:1466 length:183 start_codon:yes stop_codon:yes gene_type:complete
MPNPSKLEAIYGPELLNILAEMQEIFPPVNPSPGTPTDQIFYRSGQRSAVEWLEKRINED